MSGKRAISEGGRRRTPELSPSRRRRTPEPSSSRRRRTPELSPSRRQRTPQPSSSRRPRTPSRRRSPSRRSSSSGRTPSSGRSSREIAAAYKFMAMRLKKEVCRYVGDLTENDAFLRMYWTYFQNSSKLMKIREMVLFNLSDVLQKF